MSVVGDVLISVEQISGSRAGQIPRDLVRLNASLSDETASNSGFPVVVSRFELEKASRDRLPESHRTGLGMVWPSEQVLAAVCAQNVGCFKGKRVIELAAGYHGLAGLIIAKHSEPKEILITDGEYHASLCLKDALWANRLPGTVTAAKVKFDETPEYLQLTGHRRNSFDYVLASDCILWEKARDELVAAVETLLSPTGLFLFVAPIRGHTLTLFLQRMSDAGFSYDIYCNTFEPIRSHLFDDESQRPILVVIYRPGNGRSFGNKENLSPGRDSRLDVPYTGRLLFKLGKLEPYQKLVRKKDGSRVPATRYRVVMAGFAAPNFGRA